MKEEYKPEPIAFEVIPKGIESNIIPNAIHKITKHYVAQLDELYSEMIEDFASIMLGRKISIGTVEDAKKIILELKQRGWTLKIESKPIISYSDPDVSKKEVSCTYTSKLRLIPKFHSKCMSCKAENCDICNDYSEWEGVSEIR